MKLRRPTPSELAERFGLIGAFRSNERDLAQHHARHVKERLRAKHAIDSEYCTALVLKLDPKLQ